jgi:hypothetical protein
MRSLIEADEYPHSMASSLMSAWDSEWSSTNRSPGHPSLGSSLWVPELGS